MNAIEYMKNHKVMAGVICFVLLFMFSMCVLSFYRLNGDKPSDDLIGDDYIYNPVSPTEADVLFGKVEGLCDGIIVVNGDQAFDASNYSSLCQSKDVYKQKFIGYSYEGDDVVLYINVVKNENGRVMDLNGNDLGEYQEDKMNEYMDHGTTNLYTFSKNDDDFQFKKVELMETMS